MTISLFLSLLSSLISALFLFFVCQSIGWFWTPKGFAGFERNPRVELLVRFLAGFAIGLWITSVAVMLWGVVVGLSREKNLVLWIGLLAFGGRSFQSLVRSYGDFFRGLRLTLSEKLAASALVLMAGWALVFALVPPLMTDAIRYHLGVPHLWWQQGSIQKLPRFSEQHLVMMWQHASMLLLGFDQVVAVKIFHFLAYPLALLTVGATAYLFCGASSQARSRCRTAAWVSAVLLGATPTFFGNSVLGGVDAGLGWFAAMALLFWFHGDSNRAIWTGVMIGLAFCTKWQGSVMLAALALLVLWQLRQGALIQLAAMVAATFLMFLPWGLRNVIWSQDPVYPFISRFFNAAAANVADKFERLICHYGLSGEPWWQYLLYPLHLTFADSKFWFGGRFEFESEIGHMYLFILPFCLGACAKEARMRFLMFFGLLSFCLGLMQGQLPRFLMPVWVAFSIAGGLLWLWLGKKSRLIYLIVLFLVLGWNLLRISKALNQPGFAPLAYYRLGRTPENFYPRFQPESKAARWVREHWPGSKVLLVGLDGNLFWENPVVVDGPFDEKTLVQLAGDAKGAKEMADQLKAEGISLITVNSARAEMLEKQFGYLSWNPAARKKIQQFFKEQTVCIYNDGKIQVGRLK